MEEVRNILTHFPKEKRPILDGWMVEFFLHLFDLSGQDITTVFNESRRLRGVPNTLNYTFSTLIPKKDKPECFSDYHPISLCNLLYNIIMKIILMLLPNIDLGFVCSYKV